MFNDTPYAQLNRISELEHEVQQLKIDIKALWEVIDKLRPSQTE
jgi:hypothetical protein